MTESSTEMRRRGNAVSAPEATPAPTHYVQDARPAHKRSGRDRLGKEQGKVGLAVFVLAVLVLEPLLRGKVPAWCSKSLALAGILLLGYKLLTFRRWGDEHAQVPRFLVCFVVMLLELSLENGLVWIVSWSDQRKYEAVPGLQDNVELLARALAQRSAWARSLIYARWCNILHFLVAMLALAFSVIWEQVPYSGFGMMSRMVLTIAGSRLLRVACFLSTVLPNPIPGCYARRFPPPPDTWWETILAGYTTIRGFGGCNDLIFSGHGAFWVLAPLLFQTYYRGSRACTALLWLALVHTSLGDVVYKQHYSVDMILAVVVTWAVWTWLQWVYPETRPLPPRPPGSKPDRPNAGVLALICVALLLAGVIVIGGKA